jgi:battenin
VLSFCYQIGVFLSRSSLSLLQVRRTYLLTAAQALLAGLWAYIAAEPFAVEVQMALMLVVGLMGGCCYVNTYHEILKSDSLLKDER